MTGAIKSGEKPLRMLPWKKLLENAAFEKHLTSNCHSSKILYKAAARKKSLVSYNIKFVHSPVLN